jgi:hypothetical protein
MYDSFWTINLKNGLGDVERLIGLRDHVTLHHVTFSMWGIVKDKVYSHKPTDLGLMKQLTEHEFHILDADNQLCNAICEAVAERCLMCVEQNRKQFEQFL